MPNPTASALHPRDEIARSWRRLWGDAPPIPVHVADLYPWRRIRLDGSPDTGLDEPFHVSRSEERRRVRAVLDGLEPGHDTLVGLWIDEEPPERGEWTPLPGLDGRRLRCAQAEHVHVAPRLDRTAVDALVRRVVDGSVGMLLLGPPDLAWLVHPFQDGIEILVASPERREELLDRWSSWLCMHDPWYEEAVPGPDALLD
ncbi:hypothetical protein GCM10010988_06000 [Cnuibacter physcomitrellae]|uniref:DUF3885 domain-containing protein n=1 Tax=Cnuibacter physcomitrellae TaxID=1619308 RepID=A0A1X9LQV6_9MICO|nr:hypothetical protein [Cnuibacter physcomitrellae]ARJ05509.1 hypothetical protein B5808_09935 [Cnuibacter physcomitrellae]GGI35847.1 hypothetical protein GCM10010988_06000 [Cnuibacter physcomitrellae]